MLRRLEESVARDLPFLTEERSLRLASLRQELVRPDIAGAEKLRRLLEALQIEAQYGFYEDDGLLIVDVSVPTIADVEIFNTTLTHTNDYIKDTDYATVTATVLDDDPVF